ncbi:MAG: PTS system mannose/fructose/sorbose family transporter subunit IID [Treponema sp.]|jgi:PTS system mannose-specific IID component|nr:PTS system mannose/fructose/sorbose family transporter subunit IID [Treponema sp.]
MAKTNQKVSQQALKKAATRHNWALQWCWNYERMQASGFAYAMVPVMKELYTTEEEVCENLERHMQFYNSHPGTSAIVFGASVALEEGYQPEMSDSIKIALMGPLASIGDTLQGALVQPFAYLISAALANNPYPSNLLSIPVLLVPFLIYFWARWPFFWWGYRQSTKIIEDVGGQGDFNLLRDAAQVLGLTVIGGFIPDILKGLTFKFTWTQTIDGKPVGESFSLQGLLDGMVPYILPIGLVAFCYWMLKSRRLTPVKVICIIALITFVLGAVGIL